MPMAPSVQPTTPTAWSAGNGRTWTGSLVPYGNRTAALEDIIRAKERANRAKDREALPELRALRDASAGEDAPPP